MESYINQYNKDDLKIMELALACRIAGSNRIEQIKRFALKAGYKRIGIAHCISLTKFAKQLEDYLMDSFEVVKIDCQCGKIPSSALVEGSKGISCNPAGQAKILADSNTEFNISVGLCLGHDIIFNNKSKAPTTTLIVKDRTNNHNVVEAFNAL